MWSRNNNICFGRDPKSSTRNMVTLNTGVEHSLSVDRRTHNLWLLKHEYRGSGFVQDKVVSDRPITRDVHHYTSCIIDFIQSWCKIIWKDNLKPKTNLTIFSPVLLFDFVPLICFVFDWSNHLVRYLLYVAIDSTSGCLHSEFVIDSSGNWPLFCSFRSSVSATWPWPVPLPPRGVLLTSQV